MGILTGGGGLWFLSYEVRYGLQVCCASLVIAIVSSFAKATLANKIT